MSGKYYEDFAVSAKNCTEQSKGTDAFIAEFNRKNPRVTSVTKP